MTAQTVPAPPASGATSGTTLGAVVEALGAGLVRLVTAPGGLDVPVGEPVVHDPLAEPSLGPSDLLLAVGVDPHRASAIDVVTSCGARGGVGVLLKDDLELPAALVAAADAAGVALLVAPQGAAWGQLHTLLRTARSVSAPRGVGCPRPGAPCLTRWASSGGSAPPTTSWIWTPSTSWPAPPGSSYDRAPPAKVGSVPPVDQGASPASRASQCGPTASPTGGTRSPMATSW